MIWCIYPTKQLKPPPFEETEYWVAIYPGSNQRSYSLAAAVRQETRRRGRCIVAG